MLKVLSGIAIILFSTLCGYVFAKKYRQRRLFFTQFYQFNQRFLNEIAYYRRPIKEFFATYSYKGEFNDFLKEFYENLDARSHSIGEYLLGFTFLKKEDRTVIEDYFYMIGKGDSFSQNAYFSSVKEKLFSLQKEAEESNKKHGDLYVKMGFLVGIFILILIV